ncbi:MAG: hypothetical protein ACJAQS_001300 [Porticoccus sp.]|jgi:hypothetical protein
MEPINSITNLTHIIQLAVAPVFLLAGVAGFLNVLSGRLGRIVDRSRVVERRALTLKSTEFIARNHTELKALRRRILLINWSIGCCTVSALLVCMLVVTLFVGSYWRFTIDPIIAVFFVLAMLALIAALLMFIKETLLATKTIRESAEFLEQEETALSKSVKVTVD